MELTEQASPVSALLAEAEARLSADPAGAHDRAAAALEAARAAGAAPELARGHLLLGEAQYRQSLLAEAAEALEQGRDLFAALGDRAGRLRALGLLGRVLRERGDFARAEESYNAGVALARELDDASAEADLLNGLAGVLNARADHAGALVCLRRAAAIAGGLGDGLRRAAVLNNIGALLTDVGDYAQAMHHLSEAYTLLRQHGDPRNRAVNLVSIGGLYLEQREYERALEYFTRALEVARQADLRAVEAASLVNQAESLRGLGRLEAAEATFGQALELAERHDLAPYAINSLSGIGQVQAQRGLFREAGETHRRALALAQEIEDTFEVIEILLSLSRVSLRMGDTLTALEQARRALELAEASGQRKSTYQAHGLLAEAHEQLGNLGAVVEHLKAAHRAEREVFGAESQRRQQMLSSVMELERARHEAETYRLRTEAEERARREAEATVREQTQELERSQLEMISRLALAAEFRDDSTGEHTWRVGRNAALIAWKLGWPRPEIELLRRAARLHDVGKIGIPDGILLKPGRLTPAEFETMRTHTLIGAQILADGRSKLLEMAQQIALSHHERWDAQGYPHGLGGGDIPLVGRIVAVADVLDALTQERPYKPAWPLDKALAEIERGSGSHFDPAVVAACLQAFSEAEELEAPAARPDPLGGGAELGR